MTTLHSHNWWTQNSTKRERERDTYKDWERGSWRVVKLLCFSYGEREGGEETERRVAYWGGLICDDDCSLRHQSERVAVGERDWKGGAFIGVRLMRPKLWELRWDTMAGQEADRPMDGWMDDDGWSITQPWASTPDRDRWGGSLGPQAYLVQIPRKRRRGIFTFYFLIYPINN